MTNAEIGESLALFTRREDALLAKVREKQLVLPERLKNWRHWIQDSEIYLNELKNFVETHS